MIIIIYSTLIFLLKNKMFLLVKGTRIHPLGMVSGFHTNQNSDFVVGNNSNFKMILIENARYRSLFSVKAATQEQYRAGWNAYSNFCSNVLGCCPQFKFTFEEWDDNIHLRGISFQVTVMTAFIEFLIITEAKSFQLICSYLSAVRWNLIQCGVNVEFLQDPLIKSNRAALMKLHTHVKSYKLEDSRFPATPLFVKELALHLLSWGTLEGAALSLGAMLAFVCLLRRSEYLYKCPSEASGSYDEEVEGEDYHTIRAQDVLFEFLELNDNGVRTSVFVHPSNAYLHSSDDLVALDFVIPSSKTDQAGVGMPFHVSRMKVSKTVVFDVVFVAYHWSVLSRPSGKSPFLSWDNGSKWPSYRKFNAAIKIVAGNMGFPTKHATTHVLRIGGATTMSAAGISDHIIMIYGRWKSLAFLLYARKSRATSNLVTASILNPSNLTSSDVTRSYRHGSQFLEKLNSVAG